MDSDVDLFISFLYNIVIKNKFIRVVYMGQAFYGVSKRLQFLLIEPVAISKFESVKLQK